MEKDVSSEIAETTPTPPLPDPVPNISQPVTRDQIILKEFILKFEALHELWDSSYKDHINKVKRRAALNTLLNIYKNIKRDANIHDVRKKINSLRSNYRKELKKVEESKRSGAGKDEVYQPKSWVFHSLHFLNKPYEIELQEKPTQRVSTVSETSQSQDYEDQHEETDEDKHEPHRRVLDEQSLGAFSFVNVSLSPPPKQRKTEHVSRQNALSNESCSQPLVLSQLPLNPLQGGAPINATALYWSQKLDKLDPTQKLYAEKYINEILLEAELGNLGRNSVYINCYDQK